MKTILISDKIDFISELFRREVEGHYTLPKGKVHQEVIILNIYAQSIRILNIIKETLVQLKSHILTITQLKCANFSNTLSPIDRLVKLKLKEMMQ